MDAADHSGRSAGTASIRRVPAKSRDRAEGSRRPSSLRRGRVRARTGPRLQVARSSNQRVDRGAFLARRLRKEPPDQLPQRTICFLAQAANATTDATRPIATDNQTASRAEAEAEPEPEPEPSDSDSGAGDDGVDNVDSQGAESTNARTCVSLRSTKSPQTATRRTELCADLRA